MEWDGSFLGNFTSAEVSIIEKHCNIDGKYYYCKSTKNMIYCIIDELKPIFNIQKIGTHQITIDQKHYVIYNISYLNPINTIANYNHKKLSKTYINNIRKIIVFKELFGITPLNEKSILADINCKYNEEAITKDSIPLSVNELTISITKNKLLPQPIVNKWFVDVTMSDILKLMLNYYKLGETECFNQLRTNMQDTINRIDHNYIYIESVIIQKISEILI